MLSHIIFDRLIDNQELIEAGRFFRRFYTFCFLGTNQVTSHEIQICSDMLVS